MDPKAVVQPLSVLSDCTFAQARSALDEVFAADALIQLGAPWVTGKGPEAWADQALAPLYHAMPDAERRI